MKLQVTLYGSAEHFGKKDSDMFERTLSEIGRVFGQHLTEKFSPTKIGILEVKIKIDWYKMPIERTYIADGVLESVSGNITHEKLEEIAQKIGMSWVEYVRTFIDSSGLIAFRIASGKTSAKWSPHGAGL